MASQNDLRPLYEGDRLSADQWTNVLIPLLGREDASQEGLVDSLGTVHSYALRMGIKLIGAIADEDCPGWKKVFHIRLGVWDPSIDEWEYEEEETVHAKDMRYDVPYPEECSTGLVTPRASDTYGIIYEVVAWDCSPPPCYY